MRLIFIPGLLGIIRSKYWPIGGKNNVTKAVNRCARCFRAKPCLVEYIMADLPKERTRRKPKQIWSANAANFLGARNELYF